MAINIMQRLLFFLFLIFSVNFFSFAQKITTELYDENNGLIHNNVNQILQDPNGFIWIATDRGLSRFDGHKFINFNLKQIPVFFDDDKVEKLYISRGCLYIMSAKMGCIKINLSNYKFEWITKLGVHDVLETDSGDFYTLYANGAITRLNNGELTYRFLDEADKGNLLFVNDKIYASIAGHDIFVLNPKSLENIETLPLVFSGFFNKLVPKKNEGFYYFQNFVAFDITKDHSIQPIVLDFPTSLEVYDDSSFIYISLGKKLIVENKGKQNVLYISSNGMAINTLFVQNKNIIWVSTNQGLVKVMISAPNIQHFMDEEFFDQKIRVRRKIVSDNEGNVYYLGSPNIAKQSITGEFTFLNNKTPATNDGIIINDTLYFCTEGAGFQSMNLKNFHQTTYYPKVVNAAKDLGFFYTINQQSDSTILFGGKNGIFRYNIKNGRIFKITMKQKGHHNPFVFVVKTDPFTKDVYVGCDKGFYWLNPEMTKVLKYFDEDKIQNINVKSFLVKKSQIWVGSEKGIDVIDKNNYKVLKRVNKDNFLTDNRVAAMLEDSIGRVWVSTFKGISCLAADFSGFIKIRNNNGLKNSEYNYLSAAILPNGHLIFGGLNAYDIIDPSKFIFRNVSSEDGNGVYLTSYSLKEGFKDQVSFLNFNQKTIDYNPEIHSLKLNFSTLSYHNLQNVNFQYQLNEQSWVDLYNNPEIVLTNLLPGKYILKVLAFDGYDQPLVSNYSLKINARIPFYKTKYFLGIIFSLIVILLLIIIGIIIKLRDNEQKIKDRISMDLHDEVGTILTRSLLLAKAENSDGRTSESLKEAVYALRTYVRTMIKKVNPITDLKDEINLFLHQQFENSGFNVNQTWNIDEKAILKSELFRDIRLCIYEFANNSIKHSGGNEFNLDVECTSVKLNIEIKDNGKLATVEEIYYKGNGISNIKKRVERNNGDLKFSIIEPSGLKTKIKFYL
jgi:ligand-binding sensor domain-containing protein/anti-sigma regulatory factor (Ser/Thr protein kinase)